MSFNFEKRQKALQYSIDVPEKKLKFSEIKRQFFHLFYGLVIIYSVIFLGKLFVANILTIILIIGGLLSYIHIRKPLIPIDKILEHVERENSLFPGKGGFFFTFGSLMTLYIFPENIALAGLCVLTFGDSFSHIFGIYIRRKKYNNPSIKKMFEGNVAGIIVASIAASFFVDPVFGFIGATIAMVVEFLEFVFTKLDDNFYIPLIASLVIVILTKFFT